MSVANVPGVQPVHRCTWQVTIICGILLVAGQAVFADEPSPPPASLVPKVKVGKVLQLPSDVEISVDSSAESKESSIQTQQMIRDALDGKDVSAAGALGDVLQALRSQGSVLKGTSLDDEIAVDGESGSVRELDPHGPDSRAIAAESLLRSARLLQQTLSLSQGISDQSAEDSEKLNTIRKRRSALIYRMQREAFVLLRELVLPTKVLPEPPVQR